MADYSFTEQELNDLKDIFFSEAGEILLTLDQQVLRLEQGRDRAATLKNIQRSLHTLKGNSRALGFTGMNTVAHRAEDLLKAIQDASAETGRETINLLLAVNDRLQKYVEGYRAGDALPADEALLERIGRCSAGLAKETHAAPDESCAPGQTAEGQDRPAGAGPTVHMLRVDAGRVDKILNLVGELVIGRSMIGQVLSEIDDRRTDESVKRLADANTFMEKTLSQLQKNVMHIRMLPISQVFRKFPRVVRDLALEKGKEVELVTEGEKTELDKSILDAIGEPMIHLVRNAVDHGIEPPDERERAGKPRTGTVTLRARHEGNQIVVDVRDDGKGIDPAALRKKAADKGFLTPETAARMTDDEALELIFLSGFSTADVVTDISGRGLGMDIVRTTVESLKGKTQVRSTPGEGSVFTMRLPLTLTIIKAMLFHAGGRLLALPLSVIEMIVRLREGDVQTVAGKNVFRHRDSVISLISLEEALLTARDGARGAGRKRFAIVVSVAGKRYGFMVERLEGQQELVIKALEDHWGAVNCTSGASILGNGKVVLILDAAAIVMKGAGRAFAAA